MLFLKRSFQYFSYIHIYFFFYVKNCLFRHFLSFWCCDHLDQALNFVKLICPDKVNLCLLKKLCKRRNVVVGATRTVDIGLDISVVEHLTSDAWVPGSIAWFSHTFSLCFFLCLICIFHCIRPQIPPIPFYTFLLILVQILTILRVHTWTYNIYVTLMFLLQ